MLLLRLVTQVLVLSQENPSMITKSLLILNLRRLENEKLLTQIFERCYKSLRRSNLFNEISEPILPFFVHTDTLAK